MSSTVKDFNDFTVQDWIAYTQQQHSRSIDMTLERISQVWQNLNGRKPPLVITVAGTNGKGSSVSMFSAVLQQAGYKVGCFTSPHLIRYNERVAINQDYASDSQICQAFCQIEQARGDITLTYFEYSTLNALLIFQQENVDIAVLEVGMGGRLDSVNMLDNDIALITSIGLDHTQWLGDTLELVGAEKAGVLRSGRVGVFADSNMPDSIAKVAKDKGAYLQRLGEQYHVDINADGSFNWQIDEVIDEVVDKEDGQINIDDAWRQISSIKSPYPGEHQIRNTAGVVTVLANLAKDWQITPEHLKTGLAKAKLSGRCQKLLDHPEVIVDVAHNEASVRELTQYLASLPKKHTTAVFGALSDKDLSGIITLLHGKIDAWYLASIEGERGQTAESLKQYLMELNVTAPIMCFDSATSAYQNALEQLKNTVNNNERILVFGSFYIAGDILAYHQQTPNEID